MSTQSTELDLDVNIVELFAFASFKGDRDPDMARFEWQNDPEARSEHRKIARENLKYLYSVGGIRCRTSNSLTQQKAMDWLMTIPPRPAYTAEELS